MESIAPADISARLSTHEKLCGQRQGEILNRVGRIEKVLIGMTGALIMLMAEIIIKLSHL